MTEKTEESRFTDANGDYKNEGSFAHSLYANYIANADKAGCKTILCITYRKENTYR